MSAQNPGLQGPRQLARELVLDWVVHFRLAVFTFPLLLHPFLASGKDHLGKDQDGRTCGMQKEMEHRIDTAPLVAPKKCLIILKSVKFPIGNQVKPKYSSTSIKMRIEESKKRMVPQHELPQIDPPS